MAVWDPPKIIAFRHASSAIVCFVLTLIIANKNYSSWSLRPWLMLRELGVAFEEELVPFGSTDFRRFSPTGHVPCLRDHDLTVWDSLAIIEYLAERYPGVWPSDRVARAFARSSSAEMHSSFVALRTQCATSLRIRVRLREPTASLQRDLARLDALWRQGLDRFGGPFLAGSSFTAVDAFFAPVAFRVQTYGLALGPSSMSYVQRLLDRPTMRQWYDDALVEPWVDAAQDAEISAVGDVVEDLWRR